MTGAMRSVVVHPDSRVLAHATAARLLIHLLDVQSVRRPVHLVLTGGGVGIATLAAIADSPLRDSVDWTGVHLWWGDERFLPSGDPERNETQARAALIDGLVAASKLPAANVHPIAASDQVDSPEQAAARYVTELAAHAPGTHDEQSAAVPSFDVVLLGMGPDGHLASLFPGHAALEVTDTSVVAVHDSPKPPPQRVTLTYPALAQADELWFVAAGEPKADALAQALAHDPAVPASQVTGRRRTLWLVDLAASGG